MSKKKDSFKPWLSRPAVNRSVTLPLTRPLTQRLSNLNEFHPNELDPYLLFDARDSMIGTLENPTLDLDPSKPDTLNVITATRSGTATYTDVNGNIATAAADTVRVDHVDSVPMILVEPSATNLITYSTVNNSWGRTGITVLENEATSPDGTNNASKLLVDSTSLFHFADTICSLGAEPYSFSCYLKANTANTASLFLSQGGNNGAVFDLQAGSVISVSGTGNTATIEDVGDGWFRCVLTNNGSANVSDSIRIGVANGAIGPFQGDGTSSIYVWGAQVETGSVATSYIPTSGSTVTRQADDLVISGSDFTDFYNQSEGTVYVEAASRKVGAFPRVFKIQGVSGSEYFELALNSTTVRCRYDNVTKQVDLYSGVVSDNTFNKIAVAYKTNDFLLSVDGGASLPDNSVSLFSATAMRIGNTGSSTRLNGHIKRLIFWPTHSSRL